MVLNFPPAIPVSDGCKSEVRAFKIEMYRDLNMDKAMGEWGPSSNGAVYLLSTCCLQVESTM